jgi:hypothetical protein
MAMTKPYRHKNRHTHRYSIKESLPGHATEKETSRAMKLLNKNESITCCMVLVHTRNNVEIHVNNSCS